MILLTRSKSKLDKKDEAQKDNAKQEASRARVRLAEGFRSSLSVLQSKLSDKDFLYRVPWVLALGETNSGKTSLLRQLDGQSSGNDSGVEWFFLQHGALLDIPGDFLIGKDGTTSADGRWKKLLKLLVRYRPHRPIDGILLTIPAPSMMGSRRGDGLAADVAGDRDPQSVGPASDGTAHGGAHLYPDHQVRPGSWIPRLLRTVRSRFEEPDVRLVQRQYA